MTRRDGLVAAACLCLVLLPLLSLMGRSAAAVAVVRVNGAIVLRAPLHKDADFAVPGREGVHVHIERGTARIAQERAICRLSAQPGHADPGGCASGGLRCGYALGKSRCAHC